MDTDLLNAQEIFTPLLLKKGNSADKSNLRFVHYTSAEAAMNIIKTQRVWLRNTQCMNDYSELQHGLDCLVQAFRYSETGECFKNYLNSLFPEMVDELVKLFDGWVEHFLSSTYITCVSEHLSDEDLDRSEDIYGRLSMWRAYGGKNSVALVVKNAPFLAASDELGPNTYPVDYLGPTDIENQLHELQVRMTAHSEVILRLGKQQVFNRIFEIFKNFVFCVKHPGFKEEREWRVIYNPAYKQSEHIKSSIEIVSGVPQQVYNIPLEDIPKANFTGASIPNFIDRVIIGPNEHQTVLKHAFKELLTKAGCQNAGSMIYCSGIPLR
jgi:hypothetical protein